MPLRALIIDEDCLHKVAQVIAHAQKNHYFPSSSASPPGDDPRFVANLGTYRCVFTFTHADGLIYRHLSISVPSKKYPNPIAAFTIAELFGFSGYDPQSPEIPGASWLLNVNENEHCIVLAQPVGADVALKAMQ